MIALDIDGTILTYDGQVSRRVLTGIGNAVAMGVPVVLATGRPVISTLPLLVNFGLTAGNVLCSNGAVRMDAASGKCLEAHRFDAGPMVERLRSLLPGALFAVEQVGAANLVTGRFPSEGTWPEHVVDHATLVAEPVTRLTVWWHGHTVDEMSDRLSTASLDGVTLVQDHMAPCMVAIPAGITKGSALERLRIELDVAAESTLAVGDGENDIEMLRWAGHGVAMGHAPDTVKSAAQAVTGTIDDDGLATVLERWYA